LRQHFGRCVYSGVLAAFAAECGAVGSTVGGWVGGLIDGLL
jgi:hypothetical protein